MQYSSRRAEAGLLKLDPSARGRRAKIWPVKRRTLRKGRGGMRIGTIISLGASAVLGVGALFVAKVWLPQGHGGVGGKAQAAQMQTVPVVVASAAIPYGAKLEAAKL